MKTEHLGKIMHLSHIIRKFKIIFNSHMEVDIFIIELKVKNIGF